MLEENFEKLWNKIMYVYAVKHPKYKLFVKILKKKIWNNPTPGISRDFEKKFQISRDYLRGNTVYEISPKYEPEYFIFRENWNNNLCYD